MADKNKPLTLADIISTQKKGDIQMSEFMRAQIAAKQAEFAKESSEAQIISKPQKPAIANKPILESTNISKLIDAIEKNTKQLSMLTDLMLKKNTNITSSTSPNNIIKSQSSNISQTQTNQNIISPITSSITSQIQPTTVTEEKRQLDNTKEQQIEQTAIQEKNVDLLEKIEKNTEGLSALKDLSKDKSKETAGPNLGLLGTGLAIAIGSAIGIVQGQIKAIKLFSSVIVDTLKVISKVFKDIAMSVSPIKNGIKSVQDVVSGITKYFSDISDIGKDLSFAIRKKIAGIFTGISFQIDLVSNFFTELSNSIKKLFDNNKIKSVTSVFKELIDILGRFAEPFVDAFNLIKDALSGPVGKAVGSIKQTFSAITEYIGAFASKIGVVSNIVGKIFYPITVIMTLWDTVKGAIEGFKKDGIIGGIKGALQGFLSSLITGPLDLLKDAAAYVAGLFGFDNVKNILKSFSIEKIVNDFIQAPIDTIKNIFSSIADILSNIKIPAIGFELFGKKVQIGPWQPFKKEQAAAATQAAAPATEASPAATPSAAASTTTSAAGITPTARPAMAEKAPMTGLQSVVEPKNSGDLSSMSKEQLIDYRKKVESRGPIGNSAMSQESYNRKLELIDSAIDSKTAEIIQKSDTRSQSLTTPSATIYNKSMENKAAEMNTNSVSASPTIVNAPTQVNNSSQNAIIKTPIRNADATLMTYLKSRFA